MFKSILQAAALAAAVLSAVPVLAEAPQPRVSVHYGDLDLTKAADVKRLDRRLAHAVAAVCPSAEGVREMTQLRSIARCRTAKQAEIASARQLALSSAQTRKTAFATAP